MMVALHGRRVSENCMQQMLIQKVICIETSTSNGGRVVRILGGRLLEVPLYFRFLGIYLRRAR